MNARIAKLEQYHGIPIPFFVTWRTDGVPDFKVINEKNRKRCALERLCWICGERLGSWIVFIGGPKSVESRLFVDGPMHRECALDAMALCPFLVGRMDYAKTFDLSKHVGVEMSLPERVSQTPPEEVAMFTTRGFGIAQWERGWFFHAHPAEFITWQPRKETTP